MKCAFRAGGLARIVVHLTWRKESVPVAIIVVAAGRNGASAVHVGEMVVSDIQIICVVVAEIVTSCGTWLAVVLAFSPIFILRLEKKKILLGSGRGSSAISSCSN